MDCDTFRQHCDLLWEKETGGELGDGGMLWTEEESKSVETRQRGKISGVKHPKRWRCIREMVNFCLWNSQRLKWLEKGKPLGKFMSVVKEDAQRVGVTKEGETGWDGGRWSIVDSHKKKKKLNLEFKYSRVSPTDQSWFREKCKIFASKYLNLFHISLFLLACAHALTCVSEERTG